MNKSERRVKGHGYTVNLPGKGWCFHRGAKQVDHPDGGDRAIWVCQNCQNVASLTVPDTDGVQ